MSYMLGKSTRLRMQTDLSFVDLKWWRRHK